MILGTKLVNQRYDKAELLGGHVWRDAVAEVKHMAIAIAITGQDFRNCPAQPIGLTEQRGRSPTHFRGRQGWAQRPDTVDDYTVIAVYRSLIDLGLVEALPIGDERLYSVQKLGETTD